MTTLFSIVALAAATGWVEIDEANHVAGRKTSEGYLQGKVVLVDVRDYTSGDGGARMQEIWTSFRKKPFVLLGSPRGDADAGALKAALEKAGVTFPVYLGAALADPPPPLSGDYMYVVAADGHVAYHGRDDRRATEVVVTELANLGSPATVKQFRRLIDYESEELPGRALLHLMDFRKKFPAEAKEAPYAEKWKALSGSSEMRKLAKLEELSRMAKDYDPYNKRAKVKITAGKVDIWVASYKSLRDSENPVIVREAKNCLADFAWAAAELREVEQQRKGGAR